MRKVTETVVNAFLSGHAKYVSNTHTDGESLFLHGNRIARKVDGKLEVTTCGWNTPTTKERLNALPGVRVNTKAHQLYLNGKAWDGKPVLV